MSETTQPDPALCCAQFYENDFVQQLLGDSFHPGGKALSARLVRCLGLPPGSKVLDVACGVGTTTRMMADQFGFDAIGLDFSSINTAKANELAKQDAENSIPSAESVSGSSGLPVVGAEQDCCNSDGPAVPAGLAQFITGSADALPFADQTFDGVICECAVSTFADQEKVASEFMRVLKPGGVLGITDMVVNGDLPEDVREHVAPWTCMSKALSVCQYQNLFLKSGFSVAMCLDESAGLLSLISDLKRKLIMAGVGSALGALSDLNLDIKQMRELLKQASQLVNDGTVEYGLIVFARGKRKHPFPFSTEPQSTEKCC